MARIRTVKPEFWSSPDVDGMDPWARLLYVAMWNWADDHGRGTAEPRELMGFAFPREDWMTPEVFRRLLGEIHRGFGVMFYKVRGRAYYEIPSWQKHQKIDKRSGTKHPAPSEGEPLDPDPVDLREHPDSENPPEVSADPPERPPEPAELSALEVGTGEQGNRGVPPTAGVTAQAVIAEWIDRCPKRPPGNVIGQISKHVKAMLEEGVDPDDVRRGLAAWMGKKLHPSTLPSVVNEVMNHRPRPEVHPTDANIAQLLGGELRALPGGRS